MEMGVVESLYPRQRSAQKKEQQAPGERPPPGPVTTYKWNLGEGKKGLDKVRKDIQEGV